ncbi:hypothetical protein C0J52_24033 [Blattella germanica]|nr:hypothetical protein C0J52_24033 [Blattella germanica]PSN34306.1 hypothetical protein C0J52_24033 [Blattella germanica]
MAQQLPKGLFVGFKDLTEIERRKLVVNASLEGDGIEIFPGGRIFITAEKLWPQRQCPLDSFNHLMTYALLRRSVRKICKMYRKVKRSNRIVRCYLKTTQVALQEITETCLPFLGFQIVTIDDLTLLGMKYVEELMANPADQYLSITRHYKTLLLQNLQCRWFVVEDFALNKIRSFIKCGLNALPQSWLPEPFIQIPPKENSVQFMSDTSTSEDSSTLSSNRYSKILLP